MNNKSNGHLRSSLTSKNKPNLHDKFQVSVDKLRYKVSKTMTSTDLPRNAKSKDKEQNSHNKSKQKSKSHLKVGKQNPKSKPKSKPKKKEGKEIKLRNKRSYDMNARNSDETYNNTDRRKSSLKKHHQTEVYEEYLEPENEVIRLQIQILKLDKPKDELKQVTKYYEDILRAINQVQESKLHELLVTFHKAYTSPALEIFELIQPYENLLFKRKQLNSEIEEQLEKNKHLYEQIYQSKSQQQINRLYTIIQTQRKQIEQLQIQKQSSGNRLQTIFFEESNKDLFKKKQLKQLKQTKVEKEPKQQHQRNISQLRSPKHIELPKDFKIDLSTLRDSKPMGYHQQFMSKLADMSESWREQALRQKRY